MFEKTQKVTNPSILTADPVIQAKSKAGSITSTQASGEEEAEATLELPDVLSDLKGGIFAKGLLQLRSGRTQTQTKHNWWIFPERDCEYWQYRLTSRK